MNPIERMRLKSSEFKLKHKIETKTSRGMLSKGWYVDKYGVEILVKGNNETIGYETQSEVLVSLLLGILGIPHVEYWLDNSDNYPEIKIYGNNKYVSVCKSYLKEDVIETMTFSNYIDRLSIVKGKKRVSDYWPWLKDMDDEDNKQAIYLMLNIDALVGNQDRHLNNWDMLRYFDNSIDVAPMFDFGASLLGIVSDRDLLKVKRLSPDSSKPFKDTHIAQMQLLKKNGYIPISLEVESTIERWEIEAKDVLETLTPLRASLITKYLRNRLEAFNNVCD